MKTQEPSPKIDEQKPSAKAFIAIIFIALSVSIFGILSSIMYGFISTLLFSVILFIGSILSFFLFRKQLWQFAVFLILSLCMITAVAAAIAGMGMNDIAMLSIPALLIFSGILLRKKLFFIFSSGAVLLLNGSLIFFRRDPSIAAFDYFNLISVNFILLSVTVIGRLLNTVPRKAAPDESASPQTNAPQSFKAKIIIVDDNIKILDILERSLTAEGYKIFPFSSSLELSQWLEHQSEVFDLLITDYFLNESDGRIVIEQARKIHPTVPIILMSGYPLNKLSFNTEYYHNVEFMQKPFSAQEVIVTIEKMLP